MPFVRPAVSADLPALEAFDEFHEISAEVLQAGGCIVAGFDDAVFAYLTISRNFFNRRFVEYLFVHPDQRRKGLADALLAYAEAAPPRRSSGFPSPWATSPYKRSSNAAATNTPASFTTSPPSPN